MAQRLFFLVFVLATCGLTTGCPDNSHKRAEPDYNNMQDDGGEFGDEDASE